MTQEGKEPVNPDRQKKNANWLRPDPGKTPPPKRSKEVPVEHPR
jgi:hypothetical protein